jgi:hypothetical protein
MRSRGVTSGNITMILEVAILDIHPGDSVDFERAFAEAQAIIAARSGHVRVRANSRYTLPIKAKGLEDRDPHYPRTCHAPADERNAGNAGDIR